MKHGSLFSGIGGFDLAAEWAGWENVFHCEWNSFGQKVLKYHFPKSITYEDITKTNFSIHRGHIDVLSGGFPCQPYSTAGLRKGKEDERHLFPEMLRAIKEIKPRWIVGENVRGLISWNEGMVFHEVYDDLEREGYEVQSFLIPAASVGAPHQRYRVWFVAYAKGNGSSIGKLGKKESEQQIQSGSNINGLESLGIIADSSSRGMEGYGGESENKQLQATKFIKGSGKEFRRVDWEKFPTKSPVCGGNDGIPRELDSITFSKWRNESIKAYGNAIVPQVAYQIFKTINTFEEQLKNLRKKKSR